MPTAKKQKGGTTSTTKKVKVKTKPKRTKATNRKKKPVKF